MKSVEFSYPTSTNAKKLGFYKTGCWTVEIRKGNAPSKTIKGFSKKEDAITYAESLSMEWCPIYLRAQEIRGGNHVAIHESTAKERLALIISK